MRDDRRVGNNECGPKHNANGTGAQHPKQDRCTPPPSGSFLAFSSLGRLFFEQFAGRFPLGRPPRAGFSPVSALTQVQLPHEPAVALGCSGP